MVTKTRPKLPKGSASASEDAGGSVFRDDGFDDTAPSHSSGKAIEIARPIKLPHAAAVRSKADERLVTAAHAATVRPTICGSPPVRAAAARAAIVGKTNPSMVCVFQKTTRGVNNDNENRCETRSGRIVDRPFENN
eukprot:scaffold7808_cov184-Amphora_coffeaeformis.AAC.32